MQTSTHYNLKLVEGTDLVNPLTIDKPNYEAIDAQMYANSTKTVDEATCIKTGTVHAVTRVNTACEVFRFTATGNWETGDTMTLDGGAVSVYLPSGEAPLTNAFVINSEVLCIVAGSRVTMFAKDNEFNPIASNVSYNNTISGLTADNVQSAVDEIVGELPDYQTNVIARVTPATNESIANALDRLRQLYFATWATNQKKFGKIQMTIDGTTDCVFTCSRWNSNTASAWHCLIGSANNMRILGLYFSSGNTVVVRKYTLTTSGLSIETLSTDVAESDIVFLGEVYA